VTASRLPLTWALLAGGLALSVLMATDTHAAGLVQFSSIVVPAALGAAAVGLMRARLDARPVGGGARRRGLLALSVLAGFMIAAALEGIGLAIVMSATTGVVSGMSYWSPRWDA